MNVMDLTLREFIDGGYSLIDIILSVRMDTLLTLLFAGISILLLVLFLLNLERIMR